MKRKLLALFLCLAVMLCLLPAFAEPEPLPVTLSVEEGGSAVAEPEAAVPGTAVTVTVTPPEGKVVREITSSPAVPFSGSENVYTFEMPDEPVTVTVSFVHEGDHQFSDWKPAANLTHERICQIPGCGFRELGNCEGSYTCDTCGARLKKVKCVGTKFSFSETYGVTNRSLATRLPVAVAYENGQTVAGGWHATKDEDVLYNAQEAPYTVTTIEFVPEDTAVYEPFMAEIALTVNKAPLTVLTASAGKEYDGQPLVGTGQLIGLVAGETATLVMTATLTEIGTVPNTATVSFDGTAKETNYAVSTQFGTLTVNPQNQKQENSLIGIDVGEEHWQIDVNRDVTQTMNLDPGRKVTFNVPESPLPLGTFMNMRLAYTDRSALTFHTPQALLNRVRDTAATGLNTTLYAVTLPDGTSVAACRNGSVFYLTEPDESLHFGFYDQDGQPVAILSDQKVIAGVRTVLPLDLRTAGTVTVTGEAGGPLPAWIAFDANANTFIVTPGTDAMEARLFVTLTTDYAVLEGSFRMIPTVGAPDLHPLADTAEEEKINAMQALMMVRPSLWASHADGSVMEIRDMGDSALTLEAVLDLSAVPEGTHPMFMLADSEAAAFYETTVLDNLDGTITVLCQTNDADTYLLVAVPNDVDVEVTTPRPTEPTETKGNHKLLIVLIVLGVLILAAVAAVIVLILRRRRHAAQPLDETDGL